MLVLQYIRRGERVWNILKIARAGGVRIEQGRWFGLAKIAEDFKLTGDRCKRRWFVNRNRPDHLQFVWLQVLRRSLWIVRCRGALSF